MLKSIDICGLRGFATNQTVNFSQPNDASGSGLTVIVGANNAGKSTVVEALRAVAQLNAPSFTQGRRNHSAGDSVTIRVTDDEGCVRTLRTIRPGSSETEYVDEGGVVDRSKILVLPARRFFNPYFQRIETTRLDYMVHLGFPAIRTSSLDQFTYRLFAVEKNRAAFDDLLRRVVDPVPDWSIDQMDSGQYFLKIRKGEVTHSSEGLGEGLVGLLFIIDALYDSEPGDFIAIDEPELSLHPALQRKLSDLFAKYSATRQIVVSTHSPYFVGLEALPNGASITRIHLVGEESRVSQLSASTARSIFGLMKNDNNPHIFGIMAQEMFFIEDCLILTEGQEDVLYYKRVEDEIESLNGTYFGWGVGGAENMERIATVLQELGYSKVVGILDGDRKSLAKRLSVSFPKYHFFAIPAKDVRTKDAIAEKPLVKGLLDNGNSNVRPEYVSEITKLFRSANQYLAR